MIEEVVVHEVAVALIMLPRQSLVFVQIHAENPREVQIPLLMPFDQLLIGTHGSRSCGKSQHGIRLQKDLSRNNICRLTA